MRPTYVALMEQQKMIEKQAKKLESQQRKIDKLATGLQALAGMAGAEHKVAAAMLHRADSQNPAQPVPEPPAVPPVVTTPQAEAPEAFGNVQVPGLVPGSTHDVAADATTTAYTPGMDIAAPPFKQLVDVTAPIEGTQNPRPLNEVKTLTDVRVGDPMNPATAFPLDGVFQNQQRTSSKGDAAAIGMAALRLAELRIEAGLSKGDRFEIANSLEKEGNLGEIKKEIETLQNVAKVNRRTASANLVPRSTNRRAPSLQSQASASSPVDDDDSDIFI